MDLIKEYDSNSDASSLSQEDTLPSIKAAPKVDTKELELKEKADQRRVRSQLIYFP